MIRLEQLTKTYTGAGIDTPVLKGVSFRIEAGEYVSIMGPSGSGKTTLMNILGCLDRPSGGRYLLEGIEVAGLGDEELSRVRNRKIGFVFQLFHLLDRTSALRNVLLPLIYAEHYPPDAERRATRALEEVGLSHRLSHRPGELSGGEQQRVAIARALITDPALILADEPTGNLDSQAGAEVLSIFRRLHDQGRTVIVVTHDRQVAAQADRVIELRDGVIAADGNPAGEVSR